MASPASPRPTDGELPSTYSNRAAHGSDTPVEKRKREEETEPELEPQPEASNKRNPLWKTSLCSYYRRGVSGVCSHGDSCRYAHGEAELRPRPDGSWDPTSDRAKSLVRSSGSAKEADGGDSDVEIVDENSLDKCLIGLPRKWAADKLRSFLDEKGVSYASAKKKKGMTVGFVCFENTEQLRSALVVLNETSSTGKPIKIADANRKSYENKHVMKNMSDQHGEAGVPDHNELTLDATVGKQRNVCDVVAPLAHMQYSDQLVHKKSSLLQLLKRLTRNARKACPDAVPLPDWVVKSREIGGLPCKLEGILESPITDGYRNKCEFSVGYSLQGNITVGFMLGNFREGMTAVEEPTMCPNVSRISCKYALIFQDFLQSSDLPVWNRVDNSGFWRQFTVREGRKQNESCCSNLENQISEVMLIIQVCSVNIDEEVMRKEFENLSVALAAGAAKCSPPLPLTTIVVQDHKGISNAAPTDCPLRPLLLPKENESGCPEVASIEKARIHDYISNLRFSISPTAFFQVNTLAAERLYSLAGDWAGLTPGTLLFDICCGTGTIGLTLAHRVGMVVGIEMNESAVLDAQRNAVINGVKNYRFVCGKAEDVMGSLLKEYLGTPAASPNGTELDNKCKHSESLGADSAKVANNNAHDDERAAPAAQNSCDPLGSSQEELGEGELPQSDFTALAACTSQRFKNVVAIVDPPRVGLHPIVIKTLRTHPLLRRLVYISCNPDSLVANAIELCTPTSETTEKSKGNHAWRKMSSAGLARQRTKSMPNSEPFRPIRAMAVDLFPHTVHCEMVMLFER